MIVKPKIRGFICTTAHPDGCREIVKSQIDYVKGKGKINGPKKVLVIGASMGYGLASRISAAYGCGAATIGVIFDKQGSGSKTASAGWYNTAAFEKYAHEDGLYAKTINGDAFSREIKDETIALIKKDLGKVDMIVYSLAAPRRIMTMQPRNIHQMVLQQRKKRIRILLLHRLQGLEKQVVRIRIQPQLRIRFQIQIRHRTVWN